MDQKMKTKSKFKGDKNKEPHFLTLRFITNLYIKSTFIIMGCVVNLDLTMKEKHYHLQNPLMMPFF